jgi:16S rRNA (uracil1498-N3)-methyltransferase
VLRLEVGDAFVAFDPAQAREADAVITAVGRSVRGRFGEVRAAPRAARDVTWIHGIAKGDKCDAIVRDATELGATCIGFVETERGAVRLDRPRARSREARWARIAEEAARQCARADAPRILSPGPLDQLLVDARAVAPEGSAGEGASGLRGFVLDPSSPRALGPLLMEALRADEPLAFVAGAEGGLTEPEIAACERAGLSRVSLGERVLRTETVPAAVLGALTVLAPAR